MQKWDKKLGYIKDGDKTRYAASNNSGISTNSRGDSDEWSFGASRWKSGGNSALT